MQVQIHELVGAVHEAAWLPWAVQYFFLIAISVTALLMALPGFLSGRADQLPRARLALMVAVTTGITAPIALLADLHQPFRFWEFFVYTHKTSWMAWGAWVVPSYVGLTLAFAWAVHRPGFASLGREDWRFAWLFRWLSLGGESNWFARPLGIAAGAAALGILVYTGMEVMVVRARPLWNTPFLPLQFAATGCVGALGVMLVLERALCRAPALEARLNRQLALALAVVGALGVAWFALASSGLSPRHAEALASVAGFPVWYRIATWGALAIAVPFVLALALPRNTGWVTGLIAIHAAWMFRWTVFMGGQAVPKVGSGLYDALMPAGLDGLMGVIGTFGLWIFLLIAYTTFLPWQEAGAPQDRAHPATPAKSAGSF
ncbi:NrfD/PsrC family molybdoenzyme membrane anchor subunit [Pseudodonghicola flavimaris]|uniref:Polysulfide reductase NrfD n=1 Tax=Pseudodonghicola flavimaris TaxID=3050036 RepID=A0ABT7F5E4_9RHOB|nr:NrfD/PsrC family molybdoenzyme membrane anchor subunit [Pseudodonghicola flavimaris]MDK3019797.1 polysulfide reductase NrfD [Pseudodonghicola flavimaris]